MDNAEDNPQLAQLMAEMAWLRRLARALLKGTDGADDLVQDTWLAASEHAPADAPLRPWLSRVALNLVRSRGRSHTRRVERERAAGEWAVQVRTPEELVHRIEIQRLVADEVVRLAEPYRSTIVLHYFEELSSADIARRLDLPEGTVRRRLKVALDQLRDRLGARDPKRARALYVALLPLVKQREAQAASTGATVLGVIAMKKLVAAVVILVLLIGGAIWWKRSRHESPSEPGIARNAGISARGAVERDRNQRQLPPWFGQEGVAQKVIAGRVTFDGKPVENAVVALHDVLTRAGVRPALERRTGADGKFDFGLHPATGYHIVASAPGKTAVIAKIELADPTLTPPADELELRLGGCIASIAGTIFDASGGAIPRARVRDQGLVGVDADDKGAFVLCVPRGDSEIVFSADGYGGVVLRIDAQGAVRQDVVLVPEAVIAGRVLELDGVHPVAGVYVSLFSKEMGRDRAADAFALSDADGRFRIAGLLPGRYRVSGRGEGVVTDPIDAVANVGAGNAEVLLRVAAMARVKGTVVSGGRPVAGANVLATLTSAPRRSDFAITQADGSFVIERVPVGDIVFSAAPYRVVTPAHLELQGAKDHAGVTIEVEPLATIKGRVTRLGVPVAGRVCCARTIAGPHLVFTDANGNYAFKGVPPGTYRIGADSEELGTFMDTVSVTVAAGEERTQDLEMNLAATISGIVVDQHDRPVSGVFVKWTNEKTGDLGRSITDTQGRYRCSAMTGGGPYRASVFATSSLQAPYRTADGAAYPVVELRDGKSVVDGARIAIEVRDFAISGRVLDTNGEPIVDAEVKAMAMPAGAAPVFNSWLKLPLTVTDTAGAFRLAGLTHGAYALWARSTDGGEGTITNVAAGASSATITITRPGTIEGKLVDFPAVPAVHASGIGAGALDLESSTVSKSSFRISGVRPGRYVVAAQTGYEGSAQFVDVKSGTTTTVTLTARGRGAIEGTVLDFKTKTPIAGAACHVSVSADGAHAVTTWDNRTAPRSDSRGLVVLEPAPAGPVTVTCQMSSTTRSWPTADVVLAPGGRAAVQLFSVETTLDYPSTINADFNWQITAPRVAVVQLGGAAAKAGLLVGDLVVAVDGASVAGLNGDGVRKLIDNRVAGSDVSITVMRRAQRKTLMAKTEPRDL